MLLCFNQFPYPDWLDCSKIPAQSLCPSILPASPPSSLPPPPGRLSYSFLFFFFPSPSILPSCTYKSLIKLSLHQRTAQETRSGAHSTRMAHSILGLMRPLRSGLNTSKIRLIYLCGATEQHHSPAKWWSERGFSSTNGFQDAPGESR